MKRCRGIDTSARFLGWAAAVMMVLAAAGPPRAQAAEPAPSVAGHIPSKASGDAPVTVIDREDIELSGMTNVADLVRSRLQYNSFGLGRPFVAGSTRLAILVNGRRISDSRLLGEFDTELMALPIAAVERIEILSGSAAGLHGGHAIAGAVNIVLDRDLEGVAARAHLDRPGERGGGSTSASAFWGKKFEGGRILMGVDALHRREVRLADRDYSKASWTPGGKFADTAGVSVGGNTLFGTLDGRSSALALGDCRGSAYTGALNNPQNLPGTGCGFAWANVAWADYIAGVDPMQRLERQSLYADVEYALDDNLSIYLESRFMNGDTAFRYAPSVGTFSVDLPAKLLAKLGGFKPTSVAHRFAGHGNRDWLVDLQEYNLTLGGRGRFDGIGYDVHVQYHRRNATEDGNTFVSQSRIREAIKQGRYNLENPLSGNTSEYPDHLGAIRDTGVRLSHKEVTDYRTARASLNGAAFTLGDGDARWAAGVEAASEDWRNLYDYRDVHNTSYDALDVLGSAGNSASGIRNRWAAFTELSLPVLNGWEVVLAGRHDDHEDVGATLAYQVASRYRLHEAVAVRASWSEGGRPPSMDDLYLRKSLSYPYICDTRRHRGDHSDCDDYQVERQYEGNPQLEPDESDSVSFGAVAGMGPVSLSADWFRLRVFNLPARLATQAIVDMEAAGQLPAGVTVTRNPQTEAIERIVGPLTNSGDSYTAGIDFRGRVGFQTAMADLALDARWLRVSHSRNRVAGKVQPGDFPRNRVHAAFRVSRSNVTASWSVQSVSGYYNTLRTARYKSWTGHDLTLRWRNVLGYNGMDLRGGVLNVGDRGPVLDPTLPGHSGSVNSRDSVRGRTVFVTAQVSF